MRSRSAGSERSVSRRESGCWKIGYGTGHGLVSLANAVGQAGQVHGVDISSGMTAVARARIESAGLRNVTLTVGDADVLCFGRMCLSRCS
jgi:demethylmenaquinone methyltransferase/2-methoxy-6-polyprenyl-1,4-benzoquinol methylase